MNKVFAIVVLAALATASCGKKKAAPKPGTESGSGAAAAATDQPVRAAPPDPAHELAITTSAAVVALFGPSGPATAAVRADRAGKVVDRLAESMRSASREAWDPSTVIAIAGEERGGLFKWVRDQTALVPYHGALRGAVGVMMDRLGNSLDRALLLAELLKQTGLGVRLAHATLPADVVQKLATSWSARPRPALPAINSSSAPVIEQLVQDFGVDAAAFKARYDKAEAATAALTASVRARIAEQAKALGKMVPAANVAASPDPAAFADHWWVQLEDGGVWMDLDPSLADAEPGQALAQAEETVAPDELADDRWHTLTIRVVAEIWEDQNRREATLLEHTFVPAKFYGQRISLTNIPIDVPEQDVLLGSKDPAVEARAALLTQTEWIPVLRIGKGIVARMSVTDGGELYDVSAPDANTTRLARAVQRATKKSVDVATGLLDTLPGDPQAAPAAPPPVVESSGFTAEWMEFELRAPGAPPTVARRLVFDALGAGAERAAVRPRRLAAAARVDRGLALSGETEILPMFARIPSSFVDDRTIKALIEARPVLSELASLGAAAPERGLRDRVNQLPTLPGPLYQLALARFELSGVGDQVYLDRIDLMTRRQRIVEAAAGYLSRDGFDIVANRVTVWPSQGSDTRAVKLAQGVADTAIEAAVLACTTSSRCARSANTSEDFTASGGKGWTTVGAMAALPGSLVAAPEAHRLAAADLAAGYLTVVAPGGTSWWRFDPRTGDTLGMSVRGGSVSTETAVLDNMILFTVQAGKCVYQHATSSSAERERTGMWCVVGALLGAIGGNAINAMGGSRGLALGVQILGTLITP
ncbi:MAG TPA: hypothetical protein PKU97_01540 [Kofleriaceae bacterium]|nr:hypothetical protein [Kofleriaceae bacterium]